MENKYICTNCKATFILGFNTCPECKKGYLLPESLYKQVKK